MGKAVREAMMPEPLTIDISTSIIDAARRMRAWDVREALVVDEEECLVGFLTSRDIAVIAIAAGRHPASLAVGDCCGPAPPAVDVDDPLDCAAQIVRRYGLQRLPVVDHGRLVGSVWATDLPAPPAHPPGNRPHRSTGWAPWRANPPRDGRRTTGDRSGGGARRPRDV